MSEGDPRELSEENLMAGDDLTISSPAKQGGLLDSRHPMRESLQSVPDRQSARGLMSAQVRQQREMETLKNQRDALAQKVERLGQQLQSQTGKLMIKSQSLSKRFEDFQAKNREVDGLRQAIAGYESKLGEAERNLRTQQSEVDNLREQLREERAQKVDLAERTRVQRQELERRIARLQDNIEGQLRTKMNRTEAKEISESIFQQFGGNDTQLVISAAPNFSNVTFFGTAGNQNDSQILAPDLLDHPKLSTSYVVEMKDGLQIDGEQTRTLEAILHSHRTLWTRFQKLRQDNLRLQTEKRQMMGVVRRHFDLARQDLEWVVSQQDELRTLIKDEALKLQNDVLAKQVGSRDGSDDSDVLNSLMKEDGNSQKNPDLSFEHPGPNILPSFAQQKALSFADQVLRTSQRQQDGPQILSKNERSAHLNRRSLEVDKLGFKSSMKEDKPADWSSALERVDPRSRLEATHSASHTQSHHQHLRLLTRDLPPSPEIKEQQGGLEEQGSMIEHSCVETDCTGYICAFKAFMAKHRERLARQKDRMAAEQRKNELNEHFLHFLFGCLTQLDNSLRAGKIGALSLQDAEFLPSDDRPAFQGVEEWENVFRSLMVNVQNGAKRLVVSAKLGLLRSALEPSLKTGHFSEAIQKDILQSIQFIDSNTRSASEMDLTFKKLAGLEDRLLGLLRAPVKRETGAEPTHPRKSLSRKEDPEAAGTDRFRLLSKVIGRFEFLDYGATPKEYNAFDAAVKEINRKLAEKGGETRAAIYSLEEDTNASPAEPREVSAARVQEICTEQAAFHQTIVTKTLQNLLSALKEQLKKGDPRKDPAVRPSWNSILKSLDTLVRNLQKDNQVDVMAVFSLWKRTPRSRAQSDRLFELLTDALPASWNDKPAGELTFLHTLFCGHIVHLSLWAELLRHCISD